MSAELLIQECWHEPWAIAMRNTPQSLPYHDEDVWEHAVMTVRSLPSVPDWKDENTMQASLVYAALLHDVAKPDTAQWDEEENAWTFPKHSIIGEHKARRIMAERNLPFHFRETVCKLIRNHMRIRYALEGHDTIQELAVMGHWTNLKSLCQLFYADQIGRNVEVEPPDIHWEIAEDFGFEKCKFAGGDEYRLLAVSGLPFTKAQFTVTTMSGMPCSGKTTWAKTQGLPIVSLDEIRKELKIKPTDKKGQGKVAQEAQERCKQFLRKKEEFIFDATNITRNMRNKWNRLFASYNARIRIVYVEDHLKVIHARNRGRTSSIPENVLEKMFDKLDVPTINECHEIKYIINGVEE